MTSSSSQHGILAFGAYVPWLRLKRSCIVEANAWFAPGLKSMSAGERALANWDEDSITLAVEASRDCLVDFDRAQLAALTFASTTAPFADRQNAGIVKEALNLPDAISSMDVGGSLRCGTTALLRALQASASTNRAHLCTASEKRRALPGSEAEWSNGDAAAAFVVGTGNPLAILRDSHSVTVDFVDHFRGSDASFDYGWESRWVRDEGYVKLAGSTLREAVAEFDVSAAQISHFIASIPAKGVAEQLAKAAGIRAEAVSDNLSSTLGYAGAAHPLLLLAHVLERARPGELILLLGFGQGCDVLLLEVTGAIANPSKRRGVSGYLARRKIEVNYLKSLALAGLVTMDRGMRGEVDQKQSLTALYRNRKTVLGLVGSRCQKTGAVQFPRTEIGVAATGDEPAAQEDYPLADRPALILTHTADHLAYTPDPPSYYGMIEFEGGGRMMTEFTDVEPDAIRVGAGVRMMFRIKSFDERRHFTKYFWKAAPIGGA